MSIQRILLVDDDPLSREFLTEAACQLGYQVEAVADGPQGLERARKKHFDAVLTDLRMPGMDGLELIQRLAETCPGLPTVLITAHGTVEAAVEAMKRGATDFLQKPCTPQTIQIVLERIARTRRLEAENEYLRAEILPAGSSEVIARSKPMLETLRQATRIAGSKGTVLITGESGTGKERVAHFIHKNSPRRESTFIRVNCAALSEQLLESELFGHERGTTTLRVDVRVLATTNRNLHAEVQAGRFREDLYYRLHVLPLHLAPLRERQEDLEPLAEHFARYYAEQNGFPEPDLTPSARQRLLSWTWPGNVRELENVVQRAVVLRQGCAIDAHHLLFGPTGGTGQEEKRSLRLVSDQTVAERLAEIGPLLANLKLADLEREAILATVEASGGNKTEASRRLGVTARTLSNKYRLWRQLGLVA
jgi:DNA-binding NtrC family response regulator